MQYSVLTRQSGHTVHPDKVCLTVSCMHAHPVQGLASLRTLDYNIKLLFEGHHDVCCLWNVIILWPNMILETSYLYSMVMALVLCNNAFGVPAEMWTL